MRMKIRQFINLIESAQTITAYHGTTSPITSEWFRGGTHFGTKLAAEMRIEELLEMDPASWGHTSQAVAPCIYEVRLSITNPIELTDQGEWRVTEMIKDMVSRGYISSVEDINGSYALDDWFSDRNIDAIVYVNTNEDEGSKSYIPFASHQIKIIGVEPYTPKT